MFVTNDRLNDAYDDIINTVDESIEEAEKMANILIKVRNCDTIFHFFFYVVEYSDSCPNLAIQLTRIHRFNYRFCQK